MRTDARHLTLRRWATLFAVLASGCHGGGGGDQDPVDAGVPDAVCPFPEGRSYVMSQIELLPAGDGFDLDDDGDVDNMLANLPEAALSSIHDGLETSISTGELILLLHLVDWDPPTPTDTSLEMHVFPAYDADEPLDPTNNFTGDGEFLARLDQFDLNCNSKSKADEVAIVDRVLTARRSKWSFVLTTGTGTLDFVEPRLVGTVSADYRTISLRQGATMSLCGLSALPFPGDTPGTVLDALINDATLRAAVQVDIDVDRDGLEQVVGDGIGVAYCVDGDGETKIMGRDCPCHPAIVDGISVGMRIDTILARVVGQI